MSKQLVELAKELGMQPAHVVYLFLLLVILTLGVLLFRRTAAYFVKLHDQLIADHIRARESYQKSMEVCVDMNTRVVSENTEVIRRALVIIGECTDEHRRTRISSQSSGEHKKGRT